MLSLTSFRCLFSVNETLLPRYVNLSTSLYIYIWVYTLMPTYENILLYTNIRMIVHTYTHLPKNYFRLCCLENLPWFLPYLCGEIMSCGSLGFSFQYFYIWWTLFTNCRYTRYYNTHTHTHTHCVIRTSINRWYIYIYIYIYIYNQKKLKSHLFSFVSNKYLNIFSKMKNDSSADRILSSMDLKLLRMKQKQENEILILFSLYSAQLTTIRSLLIR